MITQQINTTDGYRVVRAVFFAELSKMMNITIQKAEEAFDEYWNFVFPRKEDIPEELPASYNSAVEFYKKYFSEVRKNDEYLFELLIKKYNYREGRNRLLADV